MSSSISHPAVDLAEGHISALEALGRDATFATPAESTSSFGTAGGKYKAYKCVRPDHKPR